MLVPALYVVEPIGVNGALEATGVLWFCSVECRAIIAANTTHMVQFAMDGEYIPGTVCDECEKPLE